MTLWGVSSNTIVFQFYQQPVMTDSIECFRQVTRKFFIINTVIDSYAAVAVSNTALNVDLLGIYPY